MLSYLYLMAVGAIVNNEITVSVENSWKFRIALCYCKGRKVKGIWGVLVLNIIGTMVLMQNSF